MAHYKKTEAKEWARENLKGQWTTLVTPFTPDDEVDEKALRSNIQHIRSLGTQGAGCSWNMGEFWCLTREERLRVYDIVSDEAAGKWPIAAQITSTSYKEAIALGKHAEARGFDLLILGPPFIVTKTEEQVIEFTKVVAEATDMAIMFYNSPQFGIVLGAEALKQMCQIPNVVGVKEASFNRQISIDTHLLIGKEVVVSIPDEWIFSKGKELGFQQQTIFSNTSDWRFDAPGRNNYVQFVNRACEGDLDEEFYAAHLRPFKEVSDKWWGRTVQKFNGVLPVAMCKAWAELMGMTTGPVRLPLINLTPEEKAELRRDLEALQLLPQPVTTGAGDPR